MRMDDRVRPTGKVPPPSLTAQTVAEELGWSVSRLLGYIATGQLPPPAVVNGVYRFTLTYALQVRCDGLHLPGTYTGLPPGSPFRETRKRVRKPKTSAARRQKISDGVKAALARKREGGGK